MKPDLLLAKATPLRYNGTNRVAIQRPSLETHDLGICPNMRKGPLAGSLSRIEDFTLNPNLL